MLPENAWTLKKGEKIVCTNPDLGEEIVGEVTEILPHGLSINDYVNAGASWVEAAKKQHDGPIILMKNEKGTFFFRPDYVERVTDIYSFNCVVCGCLVSVELPLRSFLLMSQKEFAFTDLPLQEALIKGKKCHVHANIDQK